MGPGPGPWAQKIALSGLGPEARAPALLGPIKPLEKYGKNRIFQKTDFPIFLNFSLEKNDPGPLKKA